MSRTLQGILSLPTTGALADAEIYFVAKRNEATEIVQGVSSSFTTGTNGSYSQEIVNGYYAVSMTYVDATGQVRRRYPLGDVWVENGDPVTLNALLTINGSTSDPTDAALLQLLADTQAARDEAVQAAQDAEDSAAGIPSTGTGPDEVPTNADLGSAAYTDSSDYATAAQGTLAENAQPAEAGKGLSTNDFTNPLKTKLESLEGTHWRGTFPNFSALQSGVSSPQPGDYADVDSEGVDVERYIWDDTDSEWVVQSGAVAPITASQVKQLYESNPDTNAFNDAEKSKLSSLNTGTEPDEIPTNDDLGSAAYSELMSSPTDTTPGVVLTPGAYGWGLRQLSFADANSCGYSGVGSIGGSTSNRPAGYVGHIINLDNNDEATSQLAFDRVGRRIAFRVASGGTYTGWAELFGDHNAVGSLSANSLLEKGGNSSKGYLRLRGGLQVCWGNSSTGGGTETMAASFVNSSWRLVSSGYLNDATGVFQDIRMLSPFNKTSSSFSSYSYTSSGSESSVPCDYLAIGYFE